MRFTERPIHNIKNIDWGALAWIGLWMGIILAWAIPAEAYMGFTESIKFLFSANFYEVKEVPISSDSIYITSTFGQAQNNIYRLLNIGKIMLWIMTIIMMIVFLFKNPKINSKK